MGRRREKSEGSGCVRIIVAVVGAIGTIIAAIIGGPLFDEIWPFGEDSAGNGGAPAVIEETIIVNATANPAIISAGQTSAFNIVAFDPDSKPLSSGNITITATGGAFDDSGSNIVTGRSGNDGTFSAVWRCNGCAPGDYAIEARAAKGNFKGGVTNFVVRVQ